MHVRVRRSSDSFRKLGGNCSQHMPSVLPLSIPNNTLARAGENHSRRASSISTSGSTDSSFKGGRNISVGDCALFKPPKDSPPLIGVIRCLKLNKENNLQLGVNWIYRLSELKLRKGTLVDSAPNEIFYSFQKDEVPAASLLHPCKVAFLPRGVELPAGTSSFVCRRAYDSATKSLWWLTDRNDNNDQQDIDKLLLKTRAEMHSARSPKKNNGRISISQLKPASDSGQNSGNSLPTQGIGKKRDRGDHSADSVKRGRFTRSDGGESIQCKTENNLKYEIAKITEKGGGVDLERVEKLVQFMQPDRPERKLDLGTISMLAIVLASTDKVDCLNRFLHLRGLPILDGWLQGIHKGKISERNNTKDGDKSVEEFLLVLLRALDKLPVNLHTLQMCNIGRSVNHLRSHKNTEIQRKARALVDTWKKRVEAEMISIDANSNSTQTVYGWPSKAHLPEASHGGSRTPDGAMKSSVTQNSSAQTTSGRSSPGESSIKYATSSPGPVQLASTPASGKESQPRNSVRVTPDGLQIREDRSSSSNQSHNQKDDQKSSPSGSVTGNKIPSSSSRNRKSSVYPVTSAAGSQKGTSSSKNYPAHKTALEQVSHSAVTGDERVGEASLSKGSTHKIIANVPNRVLSPAQAVSGGSMEDASIISIHASSPVLLKKHEQLDHDSKDKVVLPGSEGAGSPAVLHDEEQSMTTEDSKRLNESPATDQLKSVKLRVSSFSPMNALIESCAKYSEATSSLSLEDDVGMNLLASVAAGEMLRSDVVSPSDCTERTIPAAEEVCSGDETRSKASNEYYSAGVPNQVYNDDCDGKKKAVLDGFSESDDGLCLPKQAPLELSGDRICDPSHSDDDIPDEKSNDMAGMTSKGLPISIEKGKYGESNGGIHEEKATASNDIVGGDVMVTKEKDHADHLSIGECKRMDDDSGSKTLEVDCDKFENESLNSISISQPKLTAATVKAEFAESASNKDRYQSECGQKSVSEAGGSVKVEEPDNRDSKSCTSKSERLKYDQDVETNADADADSHSAAFSCSTSHDHNVHNKVAKLENQEIAEHLLSESQCPGSVKHEARNYEFTRSRSASIQLDETDKCSFSPSGATDQCEKMMFDLNEGCSDDDDDDGESVNLSTTVPMINPLPFSPNSIPTSHSASITLASAAVRPCVPPDDLLRNKVELGWKGSASTSAFRPAETRKVLDMTLSPSNLSCPDASTSKNNRFPLDFDLNVPVERVLEEMAYRGSALAIESKAGVASNCATLPQEASDSVPLHGSGGLDLDLNIVDDTNDTGHCFTSSYHHEEALIVDAKHIQRDFDLNDGLAVDDASVRKFSTSQMVKAGGVASQPSSSGLLMNNQGPSSNFTSWFSPGNIYSTVAVPSVLPDRGEHQPFPVIPPSATHRPFGVAQFNPDVYRGSVLSSSPAVPYPSSAFQFPVFSFGTTFPFPSGPFSVGGTSYMDSFSSGARVFPPPVNSQYVRPVGTAASQFQRPYVVGLADASNNGGLDSNRRWGRQGLDLNAGPGPMESEVPLGQHSVASFQALAEEQPRMFSVSGGVLNRREPEGGWDNELIRHRHPSWQQ